MTVTQSNRSGISLFQLKLIAMVTMVIDHIGAVFFPELLILRCIGRLTFPIYCFLIVNGFLHTRSQPAYLLRLLFFAVLSQIPYTLQHFAAYGIPLSSIFTEFHLVFDTLNALFVLSMGLMSLLILDRLRNMVPVAGHLIGLTAAGGLTVLSWYIHCEYCFLGIPLIIAFYESHVLRNSNHFGNHITRNTIRIFSGIPALALYVFLMWITGRYTIGSALLYAAFQAASLFLLFFYNGAKGCRNKMIKYCFYGFYPAHLVLLAMLHAILFSNF